MNPLGDLRLRFRLLNYRDRGIVNAPKILAKNLKGGLREIGKRLARSGRARMRRDRGDEQKSLTILLQGKGLNLNVIVYSTLVQAFVDAYGLPRGVFPDFAINSRLYRWVKRRSKGLEVKQVKTGDFSPAGPAKPKAFRTLRSKTRTQKAKRSRITKHNVYTPTHGRVRSKTSDFKRLAFVIARAIFNRGIKPTFWNRKALEANRNGIIRALQNAMSRSAIEISKG